MGHVVLLGDSILDNGAYVGRGEEVLSTLAQRLPSGWKASLNARDGAVIEGITRQLETVPSGATHLIISAGGNDALREAMILRQGARSVFGAIELVTQVRDRFASNYRRLLDAAAAKGLPFAICTIYDAQLPDRTERRLAATALGVLNDVITREAALRRLPLIDLRVMFSDPGDYANAIEPSGQGSVKIAKAITTLVTRHDFSGPSAIYLE